MFSSLYGQTGATKSAAASQAWVEAYVSNAITSVRAPTVAKAVNGVTTMEIEGGTLSIYEATDAALMVTNSVCDVSNGTLFIWDGGHKYINQTETIEATKTNMIYKGVNSSVVNGLIHFENYFDVKGVLVSAPTSLATTNKVEVVQ
jgi:hypothetical protein